MVKHRNIFLVYLFIIITLGIYGIYWFVSTKNEFNSLGAKVPTAWLLIIPFVNIYWLFKYYQAFAINVKKDNATALWFILGIIVGFVMPLIIQLELNKQASGNTPQDKTIVEQPTPKSQAPAQTNNVPAPAQEQPNKEVVQKQAPVANNQ